jgi:hypothetical protein
MQSKLDREINQIIDSVMYKQINWNNHPKHKAECLCGCGKYFHQKSKYHHFYSRACYSRTHRLKGFVKRIVNHED